MWSLHYPCTYCEVMPLCDAGVPSGICGRNVAAQQAADLRPHKAPVCQSGAAPQLLPGTAATEAASRLPHLPIRPRHWPAPEASAQVPVTPPPPLPDACDCFDFKQRATQPEASVSIWLSPQSLECLAYCDGALASTSFKCPSCNHRMITVRYKPRLRAMFSGSSVAAAATLAW